MSDVRLVPFPEVRKRLIEALDQDMTAQGKVLRAIGPDHFGRPYELGILNGVAHAHRLVSRVLTEIASETGGEE